MRSRAWRVAATGFSFAVFGIGAFLLALFVTLLILPLPISRQKKRLWTRSLVFSTTQLYIRMMRGLGLLEVVFVDAHRLENAGQIVVANHPSLLDAVFLFSRVPNANCVVKSAMARNPFTAAMVSLAGYIPNSESGERMVSLAVDAIAKGENLIVFPEGTRTSPDSASVFKRGAAQVALVANCPIQPVHISCKPATLRKHEPWYCVPKTPPLFTFTALPCFRASERIDGSKPGGVQARELTRVLKALLLD